MRVSVSSALVLCVLSTDGNFNFIFNIKVKFMTVRLQLSLQCALRVTWEHSRHLPTVKHVKKKEQFFSLSLSQVEREIVLQVTSDADSCRCTGFERGKKRIVWDEKRGEEERSVKVTSRLHLRKRERRISSEVKGCWKVNVNRYERMQVYETDKNESDSSIEESVERVSIDAGGGDGERCPMVHWCARERERERGRVIYILTGWWYFARIEIAFCDEKREKRSSPSAV